MFEGTSDASSPLPEKAAAQAAHILQAAHIVQAARSRSRTTPTKGDKSDAHTSTKTDSARSRSKQSRSPHSAAAADAGLRKATQRKDSGVNCAWCHSPAMDR